MATKVTRPPSVIRRWIIATARHRLAWCMPEDASATPSVLIICKHSTQKDEAVSFKENSPQYLLRMTLRNNVDAIMRELANKYTIEKNERWYLACEGSAIGML